MSLTRSKLLDFVWLHLTPLSWWYQHEWYISSSAEAAPANWSGVSPEAFGEEVSAPSPTNRLTIPICLCFTAKCNGVSHNKFLELASAPCISDSLTINTFPFCAAKCSGVCSKLFLSWHQCPCVPTTALTTGLCPSLAADNRDVCPSASLASATAPTVSSALAAVGRLFWTVACRMLFLKSSAVIFFVSHRIILFSCEWIHFSSKGRAALWGNWWMKFDATFMMLESWWQRSMRYVR